MISKFEYISLEARHRKLLNNTSKNSCNEKNRYYEPEVIDLVSSLDDGQVDVAAGAHVVSDTGGDGVANQLLAFLLAHVWLPTEFLKF